MFASAGEEEARIYPEHDDNKLFDWLDSVALPGPGRSKASLRIDELASK